MKCAISGCPYDDIDERGSIHLITPDDENLEVQVCTTHWEAIMIPIGEFATFEVEAGMWQRQEQADAAWIKTMHAHEAEGGDDDPHV